MKKSIFKRGLSGFLAFVLCVTGLLGIGATTAYAAGGTEAEAVMISFPRDGDANYSADWGRSAKSFMNGWLQHESKQYTVYSMGSYSGNVCYCIEPGTPLATGDKFTAKDENYWDNYPSTYNRTISAYEIKRFIGRIFQYGYTGTISTAWRSQNVADADKLAHIMATQVIIWETVVGERDSDFNHVDTGKYDAVKSIVSTNHPLYSRFNSYYNSIVAGVQKHSKVPSFCSKTTVKAQNIELEWDGSKYTTTLTDSNNILANYKFTASQSGITFTTSGNKLTITATTAPSSTVSITATKVGSTRSGVIVWDDGVYGPDVGRQNLTTFAQTVNDPVEGYLNIKRVRKYGAYATGITQNVDDLLQSHTARTMLANSEFIVMLNQASTDRVELAKLLNISDLQMSYITNVEAGHGLIKVGSSLVPFANKFPRNTKLYKLMTTKPGEGV